jgi:hypothetical protein
MSTTGEAQQRNCRTAGPGKELYKNPGDAGDFVVFWSILFFLVDN